MPEIGFQSNYPCNISYDWPTRGKIEMNNVSIKYRPKLPMVLNNMTIIIQPGQKVILYFG